MKPTLVIVGRPNVGKSTLFNRLTKSRDAIVADFPGLTRDRHYGHGRVGVKPFLVVDTGGFEPVAKDGIMHEMARQTLQAIDEADVILFMVDGRDGLTSQDRVIGDQLRKTGRPVFLTVNKTEGMMRHVISAEFHELGLGEPLPISSAHGDNVRDLVDLALAAFPEEASDFSLEEGPRIAIVGKPNAGKSTLVNALLGEERVIAFDQPGTTRDSIHVEFDRGGRHYTLIDTAGIRRRGKVFEAVEKFSVIKTLQAVEDANVVVLVLDASAEISDQDAHIAGFILEAGRSLVIAVNKWDGLEPMQRELVKRTLSRKLNFTGFAAIHYISALFGAGLDALMKSVDDAYASAMAKLSTPKLTRLLIAAVEKQAPPRVGTFRPKLRYAHQGGMNPPLIVIHGTSLEHIPESYKRYLEKTFRDAFELKGAPLKVQFKQGKNPFADKKPAPMTESEKRSAHRKRILGRKKYG
ncbi:MAG: ribosome biogenesis GTPase Der [Burkholderiales bacterium]|nr:ribosome biogenesis GTPase Der [Burkholderiales bacterium]